MFVSSILVTMMVRFRWVHLEYMWSYWHVTFLFCSHTFRQKTSFKPNIKKTVNNKSQGIKCCFPTLYESKLTGGTLGKRRGGGSINRAEGEKQAGALWSRLFVCSQKTWVSCNGIPAVVRSCRRPVGRPRKASLLCCGPLWLSTGLPA